jgi:hypothetical protein
VRADTWHFLRQDSVTENGRHLAGAVGGVRDPFRQCLELELVEQRQIEPRCALAQEVGVCALKGDSHRRIEPSETQRCGDPVESRHIQVENRHAGHVLAPKFDGLDPVGGFDHRPNPGHFTKQPANSDRTRASSSATSTRIPRDGGSDGRSGLGIGLPSAACSERARAVRQCYRFVTSFRTDLVRECEKGGSGGLSPTRK